LMAAVVAYAAAITASNLIPLQVAAFATRQHLNNVQIGTVALCEVMALALTTIFATALSPRQGRIAGINGPVAVVVGQIVSLWLPGLLSLCIVRARGRWLRTRRRNCLACDRSIVSGAGRFWTVEWFVGRDDRIIARGNSLVPERRPRDPGIRSARNARCRHCRHRACGDARHANRRL
jgi:hypothetical protein